MTTAPQPQIELIPASKISIDPHVQRGLDRARVNRMVKDYQLAALGVLVVVRRDDGTIRAIDGQHRVAATIAAGYGDELMRCLVYEGLTLAEEAAMFRRLNTTRGVQTLDKFRVRVVEGDEAAVALSALLGRHGWKVYAIKDDAAFAAVGALEGVYHGKLNGEGTTLDVCDILIRVITEAWGHDANGVRGEIVAGLGAVLLRYNSRVDLVKLVQELGKFNGGPLGLIGRAKGLRDYRGGKVSDAFAEVVVELLNKNRRTNRLPDWRSHG